MSVDMTMQLFVTLGRSPDPKFTPTGERLSSTSGAVNIGFGDKKQTLWVDLAFFGEKNCETLERLAQKGTKMYVTGTPKFNAYIPKNSTEPKVGISLNVREWKIIGGWKEKAAAEEEGEIPGYAE